MRNGLRVFDADCHVVYPPDLWQRHLDPAFRDRVRRAPGPGIETVNPLTVDGRYTQHPTILYGRFQRAIGWTVDDMIAKYGADLVRNGFTGDRVAAALAVEGIDIGVVYGPEFDMWVDGIDPALQAAMARAYNRWGAEMYEASGGRVVVSGPIPLTDVTRAVQEIEYAYHHLGTRCFWTRPNLVNHRDLGDRYYDPVYELLQDLDCALATHEFMGLNAVTAGCDRFRTFTEWHAVVHWHETQSAMLSMLCGGVFERFPRLRCAYMEAGCGWLPSWLHRIDEQLELAGAAEFPGLTRSAAQMFADNCWISCECDDPHVADVVRHLGDRKIVFESDFPHPDSKYPHTLERFQALSPEELTPDTKARILWDNPMDLYRFPDDRLPAHCRTPLPATQEV